MNRSLVRIGIALFLLSVTLLGAKLWFAKFDAQSDPLARYQIVAAELERDHDHYWLHLHLRKSGTQDHDLRIPTKLITQNVVEHEPADTQFAGSPEKGFTQIWFKFWLESSDLNQKIDLKLNEGILRVKTNVSAPKLENKQKMVIRSSNWNKRCWPY